MKLWLYVTYDEYELPLIVADSCSELARKCGVKATSIYSILRKIENGSLNKSRYIVVNVEDEEEWLND